MKILPPLLLAMLVAGGILGAVALSSSGDAEANSHSATRTFSPSPVTASGTLEVTIDANLTGLGAVVETLPPGFTYVSSTNRLAVPEPMDDGRTTITFIVSGSQSFSYTVSAPDMAGEYVFEGRVEHRPADDLEVADVSGDRITVTAAADTTPTTEPTPVTPREVSATRSIPPGSIMPGDEFTVTISAMDYGLFADVVGDPARRLHLRGPTAWARTASSRQTRP